jgi:hypothetical protein
MNTCALTKADWADFLSGDLEEGRRTTMAEHLEKCPECRAEADEMRRVLAKTDAVKAEIREAVASVNWEALPAVIADRAFAASRKPERALPAARPWGWLSVLRMKPALAGLAAGLVIGGAAMYFALKAPGPRPGQDSGYYASGEFLDRAELAMARRNTLDYLEKSQYVLLDVFESAGDGTAVPEAFSSALSGAGPDQRQAARRRARPDPGLRRGAPAPPEDQPGQERTAK